MMMGVVLMLGGQWLVGRRGVGRSLTGRYDGLGANNDINDYMNTSCLSAFTLVTLGLS